MNTIYQKLKEHFLTLGSEYSIGAPKIIGYGVNFVKGQDYPKDVYNTLEEALGMKMERGDGFSISASFRGGITYGYCSSTGDFSITLSDNDLIRFMMKENINV